MDDEMQKALAADLGISDLESAEQQQLISQFGQVALKAATISVLEKMPVDKREEFTKLSEGGDVPAIRTFLDSVVPGHEEIARAAVAEELNRFKEFQASAASA